MVVFGIFVGVLFWVILIAALIQEYGYIDRGGKHPKAIIGNHTLPYKRENPVKACYVTELLSIIDSL